jgi:F-type H+-transporting ATPase subunit a
MEGIHITLKAEEVVQVFGVPITNTMLMSWFVAVALIVVGMYVGRHLTKIPRKLQTTVETCFGYGLDYMEQVLESRRLALHFFPLVATVFMCLLLGTWLGMLPGVGSVYVNVSTVMAESVVPVITPASDDSSAVVAHTTPRVTLLQPTMVDPHIFFAIGLVSLVFTLASGIFFAGFCKFFARFLYLRCWAGYVHDLLTCVKEVGRVCVHLYRWCGTLPRSTQVVLVVVLVAPPLLHAQALLLLALAGLLQANLFALLTLFFIKSTVREVPQ